MSDPKLGGFPGTPFGLLPMDGNRFRPWLCCLLRYRIVIRPNAWTAEALRAVADE